MMKRVALGALSVLALAGAASAADMPLKAPLVAPPPAFSWTGCYIGGNGGWIGNDSRLTTSPPDFVAVPAALRAASTYSYRFDNSGFAGGVSYGCNRQYGQFVVGLDSDFDFTSLNQTLNASHPLVVIPAVGTVGAYNEQLTQKLSWFSTTRVRLGWAHDHWMIFAAGGLASGHIKSSYVLSDPTGVFVSATGSADKTRYGWTVGGGVEYALSNDWFLRAEYLYIDLGKFDYLSSNGAPGGVWNTEVDTRVHVARMALTYRFTRAGSLLEWAMGGFRY
jgi:outer membrane immunogenic protein